MAAARQRVLRACGWTGDGSSPKAVQRQTVRSLIESRRATSRTVRRSGFMAHTAIMSNLRGYLLRPQSRGWDRACGPLPSVLYICICYKRKKSRSVEDAPRLRFVWQEIDILATIAQ